MIKPLKDFNSAKPRKWTSSKSTVPPKKVEPLDRNPTSDEFVKKNITTAIHTVFIVKENILFLDEWISYHKLLGFDKFYLYDNSKVNKVVGFDANKKFMISGKINKHKTDFDAFVKLTNEEIKEKLETIVKKHKGSVKIIEWSPKDKNGNVVHFQKQAHNHCLKKLKKDNIDWCAVIDIDEFINIGQGKYKNIKNYILKYPHVSNFKIGQIRFKNRFYGYENISKNVLDNNLLIQQVPRDHSNKNIFNVKKTRALDVHNWHGTQFSREFSPAISELSFNHYTGGENSKVTGKKNNINTGIKNDYHRW